MKGKNMSTFFEIFNKVLLELNYRTVTAFEDIYKSEHIKILDAINRVNEEVLGSYEWPFLLKCEILRAKNPENAGEDAQNQARSLQDEGSTPEYTGDAAKEGGQISTIALTTKNGEGSQISTIGEILSTHFENRGCIPLYPSVNGIIKSVYQGSVKLLYNPNLEEALQKGLSGNTYTLANDGNSGVQILVNPQNKGDITVYYYPKYTCLGALGQFKTKMDAGDDVSILPMPYAEHILLYGTCLKAKANPAYPKFGFWNTMYIQALANLRKKSASAAEDAPFVKIV